MNPQDPSESTAVAKSATRARSPVRNVVRWAEHVLAGVGLLFVIYSAGFELIVMTSDSMTPTLQGTNYDNGDRILLERVTGWFRAPRRWEIYHYFDPDGTPVTKRIVGLPGEKISLRKGMIYIDGKELVRPPELNRVNYLAYGNLAANREVDCKDGYFMLGDASIDSYDSRFTGIIEGDQFRGRVLCVVAPWKRLRLVQ